MICIDLDWFALIHKRAINGKKYIPPFPRVLHFYNPRPFSAMQRWQRSAWFGWHREYHEQLKLARLHLSSWSSSWLSSWASLVIAIVVFLLLLLLLVIIIIMIIRIRSTIIVAPVFVGGEVLIVIVAISIIASICRYCLGSNISAVLVTPW